MRTLKMHLLAVIILAVSCNSNKETTEDKTITDKTDTSAAVIPVDTRDTTIGGCYIQIFKKDTANLQLDITRNNVTGPLTYRLYQKDINDGSIKAEIVDSVITGWYLFRSEGMLSVRQVAWKVRPGQLWPAEGEVIQRNDTTMFADPRSVKYDNSRPFVKIKCTL
jgi:hypothetical protein